MNDLTTLPKHQLFHISWPIFVDLLLHFITVSLNILMVGRISNEAVASLAVGSQVFQLCAIIFNFVGIGSCVAIAQIIGAKQNQLIRDFIHNSIGFNIVIGIITTLVVTCGADLILTAMQIKPEIFDSSKLYLLLLATCIIPEAITMCCASVLRAYGLTKQAMYVTLFANIITITINFLLLFGYFGIPKLGILGAGIGMSLGRICAMILILYLVQKYTNNKLVFTEFFVWSKKILARILRVGLPGAGENLAWHLQFMVCTSYIASMSVIALATHTYYMQICLYVMLTAISIATGTEIMVARYIGAKDLKKAYYQVFASVKIGFGASLLISILLALWIGDPLMLTITKDPEIVKLAHNLFILSIIMEPGRILNIIIINSLRASGDARFPMIMAIASMWMISVPLAWFLGIHLKLGILGVWIAFCLDEWTRGISMTIRWYTKAWVKKAVVLIKTTSH
ncbi:MAG: MATE family efflux transporter [Succinivibrionaceae bacterium]